MYKLLPTLLAALLFLGGCSPVTPDPVAVRVPDRPIDYLREIKPLLDRRCVVCHSCYNAPCQLKLSSHEGIDRGASKAPVYDGTRLTSMDPTRLFIDARSTQEWRQKGFFSVTSSEAGPGYNDSLMLQLLAHKMRHPQSRGEYHPESDDLTCAENGLELGVYLKKHPNNGMPFGFPPLKQEEFDLIAGWLAQGAPGPDEIAQAALVHPFHSDQRQISKWEKFLNQPDAKHVMTARYLYEHLFLAHIRFNTRTGDFFELVRSRTPPGQPVEIIPTIRPYDDPGPGRFYYRFRRIHATIVHKTHMVVRLDDRELRRIRQLFIRPKWPRKPHVIGYDPKVSANPFVAFAQIPVRSRYQFLLDHAHYVIMTFIRGPVCRGQIALNVIHDHFWVMFLDPDHDLSIRYPGFLQLYADRLIMPHEQGSDARLPDLLRQRYHKAVKEYFRARQDFYMIHYPGGLDYSAIWKGRRAGDSPLLTVYRHFDSASVHRGALGNLPRTLWVIDYPLFERIYYALVAGFDVFGNLKHQLATRLYMDCLRLEGETYFLDFMPLKSRKSMLRSWYRGVPTDKIHAFPSRVESAIRYSGTDPKREFVEHLVGKTLNRKCGIRFDPVNYHPDGPASGGTAAAPVGCKTTKDCMASFRTLSARGTRVFSRINDYNANLAYIRIRRKNRKDMVVSVVVNRWHDNVTYLFGEKRVLDPARDRADFIEGFVGSYPNYFFDVREEDLADFIDLLATYADTPEDRQRLATYGINRADPRFWEVFDWFQDRFFQDQPTTAGYFDLNRYYPEAIEPPPRP